ncbi:MAG: DUF4912 domain-containing protein [Candidatus Brocadiia bacterium]
MGKGTRTKKASPSAPYIDRGEPLPRSYAENRIAALVRSPEQIYLYWDVETEVRVAGSPQVIRVHDLTAKRAYDLEPPADADSWYLLVAPNRTCRFELFERRGARLRRLAVSEEVTTPIRWAGESGEYVPAEIIQAVRHPISRQARAAVRIARALPRTRPAEAVAKPARRARFGAEAPAAANTLQRNQPAGPPPRPIPVPWEKVFAASYAGGK